MPTTLRTSSRGNSLPFTDCATPLRPECFHRQAAFQSLVLLLLIEYPEIEHEHDHEQEHEYFGSRANALCASIPFVNARDLERQY